ncbi:beta-ketoacyl synthase N-terminal-like domain-containing protein [Desulfatitalea alkaliphila]|uniref:Ketosynthase family 3 (KS3) domain-containing protein n=1 Tax=Desulfatitalea alkaliphila TaxID=2929485 RepID=A0AA41R549_9BACT|nr:beta-ketoacyl synthase N-terminal-like domain-containing protein [Desulfatitalea alkaliphila]MCJ8503029.1 hypothetical protein [Desulfatitalea alkaliphila]
MNDPERVVVTGIAVRSGLGGDFQTLIHGLEIGEFAPVKPFFPNEIISKAVGLPFNPPYVFDAFSRKSIPPEGKNTGPGDRILGMLEPIIDEALAQANLGVEDLEHGRARIYIAGVGIQPEILNFFSFIARNDQEDLRQNKGIRQCHYKYYSQKAIARSLAKNYHLTRPPVSVYSASCSSLAALYLAQSAIASGRSGIAIVVTWQEVTLYDLLFLGGLNALARTASHPFGSGGEGVVLGAGAAAIVLENSSRGRQRKMSDLVEIRGFSTSQSGGLSQGGHSFSPDFRVIGKTISKALEHAKCRPEEVSVVLPHGNGLRSSDKAEALAIRKVWGNHPVSVSSYKSQLGYTLAASGLIDIAILSEALLAGRLLAFRTKGQLDGHLGLCFHADAPPQRLKTGTAVKIGIGIEGSVAACVLSVPSE